MPPLYAILGFVIVQRLAELVFAHRNYRTLAVHGAIEVGRSHYPAMVALHAGWLLALLWTIEPWAPVSTPLLVAFILLQCGRFWVIATLGSRWTTSRTGQRSDRERRVASSGSRAIGIVGRCLKTARTVRWIPFRKWDIDEIFRAPRSSRGPTSAATTISSHPPRRRSRAATTHLDIVAVSTVASTCDPPLDRRGVGVRPAGEPLQVVADAGDLPDALVLGVGRRRGPRSASAPSPAAAGRTATRPRPPPWHGGPRSRPATRGRGLSRYDAQPLAHRLMTGGAYGLRSPASPDGARDAGGTKGERRAPSVPCTHRHGRSRAVHWPEWQWGTNRNRLRRVARRRR